MTANGNHEFPDLLNDAQWEEVRVRFVLTGQELRILRHLCRGLSNEDIAEVLGVGVATVRTHLRSVYFKMERTDRVQVILALVHGFASEASDSRSLRVAT